jgi:hypothetical protein
VAIEDVVFAGFSLTQALALHYQVEKRQPASIWLAGFTTEQLEALVAAGEPVWYKSDPVAIAPGGVCQVTVRLRQTPQVPSLNVGVIHSEGTSSAVVPVQPAAASLAGVAFLPDLSGARLYWRHSPAGAVPATILLDGTNVTADTSTAGDPAVDLAVSSIAFAQPPAPGSLHIFQGIYGDGQTAAAAARAWSNPFIYATWGARAAASGDYSAARAWIDEATNHFVNALEVQGGSDAVKEYLKTAEGKQYAADRGYGCVIDQIGLWGCSTPMMWFIRDEPDAADSRVTGLPSDKAVGSLGQMAVQTGETLRAAYPLAPTTINIDATYTPFNYYNYGQLPDVMMSDPYYQVRLREALWNYPERIPLFSKATYIYAVSQVAQSAAEPNPLHIILYACEYNDGSGSVFPFAPPETKRIEVYYALAAGAKGMAYWWFLPGNPSNGLGAGTTAANALWRQIGLLGAEIRTAMPLLVTSWPAAVPLQAGAGVWARALLSGTDTLLLLVVNDQYSNDQAGCHYTNIPNATVTMTSPSWMTSISSFEITSSGIAEIGTQPAGSQLQINLGTLALTRMIVLTTNSQLKASMQQRYEQVVRPGLCALAPELCLNTAPEVTQHPSHQTAGSGASASFTVTASGSQPLTYQWQKNLTNLAGGGRCLGASTPTLTLTNLEAGDAAGYRCIAANAYGSATSSIATLTVTNNTSPPAITQQPSNQVVAAGGSASFIVAAAGASPIACQWQKNLTNLNDGGRYSGSASPALIITSVDSSDAAGYRCVLSNAYGAATSDVATLTVTIGTEPPAITQQPLRLYAPAGGSASFTIVAAGAAPLVHQWQKNHASLSDGSRYSGCATPTLVITNLDEADAGMYRCVVANAYGTTVSSDAILVVTPGCAPASLMNASFEDVDIGGVGLGWTAYQRPPYPTNTIWSIQTASPPSGGGARYQQIANSSAGGGAGVRRDITGCLIGATYTIAGWMRGNSTANATCTVKVSPTASTNWATAIDLVPAQSYTGANWTRFSGTVKATGTNMTIWLDGRTGGTGQFKAECFDAVTVSCTAPPVPLYFQSVATLSGNQVCLDVCGERGAAVTLQRSADLTTWVPLAVLVNTNGTLRFTDTPSGEVQQRFYRVTQP